MYKYKVTLDLNTNSPPRAFKCGICAKMEKKKFFLTNEIPKSEDIPFCLSFTFGPNEAKVTSLKKRLTLSISPIATGGFRLIFPSIKKIAEKHIVDSRIVN